MVATSKPSASKRRTRTVKVWSLSSPLHGMKRRSFRSSALSDQVLSQLLVPADKELPTGIASTISDVLPEMPLSVRPGSRSSGMPAGLSLMAITGFANPSDIQAVSSHTIRARPGRDASVRHHGRP